MLGGKLGSLLFGDVSVMRLRLRPVVCIKTEIRQYTGQIDHFLAIFFTVFLVAAQTVAVCLSNLPNLL